MKFIYPTNYLPRDTRSAELMLSARPSVSLYVCPSVRMTYRSHLSLVTSKDFLLKQPLHPFHAKFGDVPFRLDRRCWGSEEQDPELIIRVLTFEVTQHIQPRYINLTHREIDRQTDTRTTYDSNTALCTTCIAR